MGDHGIRADFSPGERRQRRVKFVEDQPAISTWIWNMEHGRRETPCHGRAGRSGDLDAYLERFAPRWD